MTPPQRPTLRRRMTIWFAATTALSLILFAVAIYASMRERLYDQASRQGKQSLETVQKMTLEEPDELDELDEYGSVYLYTIGGTENYSSKGWLGRGLDGALLAAHLQPIEFYTSGSLQGAPRRPPEWTDTSGRHYQFYSFSLSDKHGALTHFGYVAEDITFVRDALHNLLLITLISVPLVLLLAAGAGYFVTRVALKPVGSMAASAERITADRLSERLPGQEIPDELGRLAGAFNTALARLEDSFDRLSRFAADASHELRSPLAVLRTVGEVGLRDGQTLSGCREVIGSMLEEVDRLSRLVSNLLTLTRGNSPDLELHRENIDLLQLARETADFMRVLAEERGQVLNVEGDEGVTTHADRALLRLGIINLLENAIKYSPANHGRITLRVMNADMPAITVSDNGPGIPEEHRARIFDRFYRVDKSRTRGAGGAGLGLAIAKWAVEANDGRIQLLESKPQNGSTESGSCFEITLPRVAIASARNSPARKSELTTA